MKIADLKRIYTEKNDTSNKYEIIKSDIKKLYTLPDSSEDLALWNVFVGIAILGIAIALLVAPAIGGENGLKIHTYAICGIIVFFFISAYMLRDSISGIWILKFTMIVSGCYALIYIAAINDFPEFIRNIQGESFVGIWCGYTIIVYIIVFIIQLVACYRMALKSYAKLKKQHFSNKELMLMSGYSSFRVTGYYLIKAKGDGIIRFARLKSEPDIIQVSLNGGISEKALQDYCTENPDVEHLIQFLMTQKELGKGKITLNDFIHAVKTEKKVESSSITTLLQDVKKSDRFGNIILSVGVGLVSYLGITKLIMGMNNDKPVEKLAFIGFLLAFILTFVILVASQIMVVYTYENDVLEKLLDHNEYEHDDFERELQSILTAEDAVTSSQSENILRCYASSERTASRLDYMLKEENWYAHEFINTIVAAEKREAELIEAAKAADRAKQRRRHGYYHGGGGGGGFGCGGCGR